MLTNQAHEKLKQKALANPVVKAEYDALEGEMMLLEELIHARQKAHKTQADIARAMGTTTSAIGRLETGGGKQKHSPTISTLKRYAAAIGCELRIKLVAKKAV